MPDYFQFLLLFAAQVLLVVASITWFLRRNDELPVLISAFLLYCGSYRYLAVISGMDRWVEAAQYRAFTGVSDESALQVLWYMVVGEIILLAVYRRFQSERLIVEFSKINVAEIT